MDMNRNLHYDFFVITKGIGPLFYHCKLSCAIIIISFKWGLRCFCESSRCYKQ